MGVFANCVMDRLLFTPVLLLDGSGNTELFGIIKGVHGFTRIANLWFDTD